MFPIFQQMFSWNTDKHVLASLIAKGSPLQRNDNVFGKLSVAPSSSPFVSKGILWIHKKKSSAGQLLDPAMGMIPIDSPKPSHDSRVTVRSLFYPDGYHWIPRHLRVFHQKCLKSPASFSTWVLQMQGKINTSDWGNGLQEENRWQVLNRIVIFFFKFKRVQTRNQLGLAFRKMEKVVSIPPRCTGSPRIHRAAKLSVFACRTWQKFHLKLRWNQNIPKSNTENRNLAKSCQMAQMSNEV